MRRRSPPASRRPRSSDPDEIYARAPRLAPGAVAAIWEHEEGIVDPFSTPYAYALDAVSNGVEYRADSPVTGAARRDGLWRLETPGGIVTANAVVNCAGLWADRVEKLGGYADFVGRPRRGQFIVFDKSARARCSTRSSSPYLRPIIAAC